MAWAAETNNYSSPQLPKQRILADEDNRHTSKHFCTFSRLVLHMRRVSSVPAVIADFKALGRSAVLFIMSFQALSTDINNWYSAGSCLRKYTKFRVKIMSGMNLCVPLLHERYMQFKQLKNYSGTHLFNFASYFYSISHFILDSNFDVWKSTVYTSKERCLLASE